MNAAFQQFLGSYTGVGYWVDETIAGGKMFVRGSSTKNAQGNFILAGLTHSF